MSAGRAGGDALHVSAPFTLRGADRKAQDAAAGERAADLEREAERDTGSERTSGAAEHAPFRPLPSCVFAPAGQARALPPPAPSSADVAQLAGELLRSLQVGGTRGRAQVRLVLSGSDGSDVAVTLEETATGVVATLHADDSEQTRRLMQALERELARRSVCVDAVALG